MMTPAESRETPLGAWPQIEAYLRSKKLGNLHRHPNGSLSPASMAALYRESPTAREIFCDLYKADPTDPAVIRQVIDTALQGEVDWELFERAFNPGRILLDNDPDLHIHREWFRRLVIESAEQGLACVGFRATFGGHWRSQIDFERVITSAVEGVLEGEDQAIRAVLFVGIRKETPPHEAARILQQWLDIRQKWENAHPAIARKLCGVDSIGSESSFDVSAQQPVFARALANGMTLCYHLGETWEPGALAAKLIQIAELLDRVKVSYLTNPMALFVDRATLDRRLYSEAEINQIGSLQQAILAQLIESPVIVEISPTGNELLTRKNRRQEGWSFYPLQEMIAQNLRVVITDDDSTIFKTSYLEEYKKLFLGSTPYGRLGFDDLTKLVDQCQHIIEGFEQHDQS
jgi:adenosine deaminase